MWATRQSACGGPDYRWICTLASSFSPIDHDITIFSVKKSLIWNQIECVRRWQFEIRAMESLVGKACSTSRSWISSASGFPLENNVRPVSVCSLSRFGVSRKFRVQHQRRSSQVINVRVLETRKNRSIRDFSFNWFKSFLQPNVGRRGVARCSMSGNSLQFFALHQLSEWLSKQGFPNQVITPPLSRVLCGVSLKRFLNHS